MHHFDIAPLAGYPDDYGLLLASLQDGTNEWRGELGHPGVDAITWQPYPGGYSIGGLLLHIGAVEVYWFESFCLGREPDPVEMGRLMVGETDVDNGTWPVPPAEPLSYYYGLLDTIRARTLENVRSFPAGETAKEHHGGSKTFRWVVSHVVQHEAYHGGQAVLLGELAKRMR